MIADHGNDPTMSSSDPTREYVPLLVYGKSATPGLNLGTLQSLSDIGQTIAENFGVEIEDGVSFLRVNRLKEGEFKVGNEYTTQDFDINNVVEKVYRPSLFISLSYSLTKRVTN